MSASAVNFSSGRLRFWQTTVGKKAIMAVTGIILFGFVVGHLIGNLQIFLPPEKINHYAATLRAFPSLLWVARITLLLSVGLHIWSSFQLWLLQREARPIHYVKKANLQLHLRFPDHALERSHHRRVRDFPPAAPHLRHGAPRRTFRRTKCLQQYCHWLPGLARIAFLHHRDDYALLSPLSRPVEYVPDRSASAIPRTRPG